MKPMKWFCVGCKQLLGRDKFASLDQHAVCKDCQAKQAHGSTPVEPGRDVDVKAQRVVKTARNHDRDVRGGSGDGRILL